METEKESIYEIMLGHAKRLLEDTIDIAKQKMAHDDDDINDAYSQVRQNILEMVSILDIDIYDTVIATAAETLGIDTTQSVRDTIAKAYAVIKYMDRYYP